MIAAKIKCDISIIRGGVFNARKTIKEWILRAQDNGKTTNDVGSQLEGSLNCMHNVFLYKVMQEKVQKKKKKGLLVDYSKNNNTIKILFM